MGLAGLGVGLLFGPVGFAVSAGIGAVAGASTSYGLHKLEKCLY